MRQSWSWRKLNAKYLFRSVFRHSMQLGLRSTYSDNVE
jgi:hypothetical protein